MAVEPVDLASDRTAAAEALGARLAAIYAQIADRSMRDLPVFNDRLRVETFGFHDDGARVIGIVATPWFMNVVITASPLGPALSYRPAGATVTHDLPSGAYDFVVGEIGEVGRIDSLSLFSPMFEFDDPEVVRATAEAAMAELLRAPEPPKPEPKETPALDRRALLFGRRTRDEAAAP